MFFALEVLLDFFSPCFSVGLATESSSLLTLDLFVFCDDALTS